MAGYCQTRLSTGVHDDLHAKAIVIASANRRGTLLACDLVRIPPPVSEEARALIQATSQIPVAIVMIDGGARAKAYGADLETADSTAPSCRGKSRKGVRLAQARLAPARAVSPGRRE